MDSSSPRLGRITVYPVKSLDGLDLPEAVVLPSGALENDRRFMIVDGQGERVNGKRTDRIHPIRSTFDVGRRAITLWVEGGPDRRTFSLDDDKDSLHAWLSAHFGYAVTVVEDPRAGFPDDTDAPGPTLVAGSTLGAVAAWFPGLDVDECRRRFRANLEISGVEPFWDDRLYGEPGQAVRFRVGEVVFEGTNPCQRCVVPTRATTDGTPTRVFQKDFSVRRRETLPAWAAASRFNHYYRLAVNTRLADPAGGTIRVGDAVEIV